MQNKWKRSRCLEAHDLQLFTQAVFPVTAGVALVAKNLGLDGDLLTDLQTHDPCSHGHHIGRDLVSLSYGVGGKGVLSVVYMNVAATDSDHLDPNEDLSGAGFGDGDLLKDDLARCGHYLLNHFHSKRISLF